MKILVLCAHMDDEVLGAGGTLAKHVDAGDNVRVAILSDRAYGHKFDAKINAQERKATLAAAKVLGVQETVFIGKKKDELMDERLLDLIVPLEEQVLEFKPDVAYIHHRGDSNQDHRAMFQASMIACRVISSHKVKRVLCYEVPSSTDMAPPFPEFAFLPTYYVDIERTLSRKLAAMKAYERELRDFPHPRSLAGLDTCAKKRGMEVGFKAAEAFVQVRDEWT